MPDESDEYFYKIKYNFDYKIGSFKKSEIIKNTRKISEGVRESKDNVGYTDALIVISILFPEDGSRNELTRTIDGNTGKPLSDLELFKTWNIMAKKLSESKELESFYKDIAREAFEIIRDTILAIRDVEESKDDG